MSVDSSSSSYSSSSSESAKGGAKWWHACLHIFTSIAGAPVFAALPLAFAYLGWWIGLMVFIYSTWASYYSGRLLLQLQGPNDASYARLADGIMGSGFASRWVRPFQFLVLYQVTIITPLLLGQGFFALQGRVVAMTEPWCTTLGGVVVILVSLMPSLAEMWSLSLVGVVSALGFIVAVVAACCTIILHGKAQDMGDFHLSLGQPDGVEGPDFLFGLLNSFGIMAFSYGGHSVLPDVQATLQASMPGHAQKAMHKALMWAFAGIMPCYLVIAVMAYGVFGPATTGYLPDNLQKAQVGDGLILALNILLIINVLSVGAIYVQGGFNMLEDILEGLNERSFLFRFMCLRVPWVASATFIAVAVPFFGDLAGLCGAIGFTPMTFVLPFLLWERSDHGRGAPWWRHVLHVFLGVSFAVMGLMAFAGSLYLVIKDSATYHFFG